MPNLKQGATGEEVRKLQTGLKTAGFDPGPIDAIFGSRTASALRNFQTSKGLVSDAIFGPKSSAALFPITSSQGMGAEDLVNAIGGRIGGAVGSSDPIPPPIVQDSTTERFKQRQEEIQNILGQRPIAPEVSGQDLGRLSIAQQQRDEITTESEKILEQRLKLEEEFQQFRQTAGEGVSEGGRAGAVSERGREIQNQLDSLSRRELVLETKLRNRNSVISEVMNLQRQSFEDATAQYNTQFSQALQLYNLFDREDDELRNNAKASLDALGNTYKTQIEKGKLSFENITGMQRAQIEELETQAGFPLGTTMAVLQTLKPEEEKLYSGVDKSGNFVYITKNQATDEISTKRIAGVADVGGSTTTLTIPRQKDIITAGLNTGKDELGNKIGNPRGADGYVDPFVYIMAFQNWSGTPTEFLRAFPVKTNVNPLSYNLLPESIRPKDTSGGSTGTLSDEEFLKQLGIEL